MQEAFLKPLLRRSAGPLTLVNQRTGSVLATRVTGAFDSSSRRTGLLRHEQFPDGEALVIAPTSAIHTFFMRFAIDVAFVRRDGSVVAVRPHVKPWRIAVGLRGYAAVELPAGTLDRTGTREGDLLALTSPPPPTIV